MDDDEPRPAAARRTPPHIRKVPGSFDDDEISPAKEHFDSAAAAQPAAPSAGGLDPDKIPQLLPPAADRSYLDEPSQAGDKVSDSFTEQVVRNHLQDIESSFAAPLSPIPTRSQDGVDDTFLFDSPRKALLPAPADPPPAAADPPLRAQEADAPRPATAIAAAEEPQTWEHPHAADTTDVGNGTSSLEGFSSPTAEATARTVSRALSRSGLDQDDQDRASEAATNDWDSSTRRQSQLTDATHRRSPSFTGTTPTLRNQSSDADLRRTSLDAAGSGHILRYGRRPRYLRGRDASQRSSVSSFATNADSHDDVESDVTVGLGTDYALQSGGAVPALNSSRSLSNMSNILSRSISMGSMLSGIDDFGDSSGRLQTLDEDDNPAAPARAADDEDLLQTPKAKGTLAPPTDTVIARRVMDVQVPESLAREYKTKGGLATPKRPSDFSGGGTQKTARNLTLKEQSSTIDRLSKENFDLKLKVMFLSDRLDKLTEKDSKEVEQENIQLRTNVANLQRDNKTLRKRIRELEKQRRDEDERPATAVSVASSHGQQPDSFDAYAQEREEELIYLRETVKEYSTVIETLRQENMTKEAEKRRMADAVKSLQTMGEKNAGESLGRQEAEDVWKDLLEQETGRREQAVEDGRKLQEEVSRLKHEMAVAQGGGGLHHTTNIYNISKKPRGASPSRPGSAFPGEADAPNGGPNGESDLMEELRRENESFKHENAELRREVGAQTSMLTSRNKEKERLYAEIEDLKMQQRRGGPAPSTIDSLFERSASQVGAHERSASRMSGNTRAETALDDPEREELENKNAELRDKINEIKLENQNLAQDLEEHRLELEAGQQARLEIEDELATTREDLETTIRDLMAMQQERDDVINELADMEAKCNNAQQEFDSLREEAQDAIDGYEADAAAMEEEIQKLSSDLGEKSENFTALQEEMRKLSEALVGLEDEQDNKARRIQQLEQDLADAHKELEELDAKLVETNEKGQRLAVQQESSQGEIAFLREEQEGDKIQISKLEVAVSKAEEAVRDEQDRVKQLQAQIAQERERSEALATNDKKEMQRFVNELNREASAAKEEARRLRKSLSSREVEATEWKERLMELENNLRGALGDLNGTRSSLVKVRGFSPSRAHLLTRNSLSPDSSESSRAPVASSTSPRRLSRRRSASSRPATACWNPTAQRRARSPTRSRTRGRRIAIPSTSSRRSRRRTSTSAGRSPRRTAGSSSSRRPRSRTRSASPSSRRPSRSSSTSGTTCCSSSGRACRRCAVPTGPTTTASSMGGRCRAWRRSRPCCPASARTSWRRSKPSRPWSAGSSLASRA